MANKKDAKWDIIQTNPGRASHHPLMAFIAETRMVANAWLRLGNTAALSNCKAFIDETFEILKDKKLGLVRADSGFYAHDFLNYLEQDKKIRLFLSH